MTEQYVNRQKFSHWLHKVQDTDLDDQLSYKDEERKNKEYRKENVGHIFLKYGE